MGFVLGTDRRVSQGYLVAQNILGFSVEGVGVSINNPEVTLLFFCARELRQQLARRFLEELRPAPKLGLMAIDQAYHFSGQCYGCLYFHTTSILPRRTESILRCMDRIDIGRPSRAVPVTTPGVRITYQGGSADYVSQRCNRNRPRASNARAGRAKLSAGLRLSRQGPWADFEVFHASLRLTPRFTSSRSP